jgi:hypothetical protein
VTLHNEELFGLEKLSQLSGVGRSPYLRTLVQWCIENHVILRPRSDEYEAFLRAIEQGVSPLPRYRHEPIVTEGEVIMTPLVKTVILDRAPRNGDTEEVRPRTKKRVQ